MMGGRGPMTEIRDGEELSIDIPDANGTCFAFAPPRGAGATAPSPAGPCAKMALASTTPAPPARLVAAGAVGPEGATPPILFTLRYQAQADAVEPTAEAAREFATHEASLHGALAASDGGAEAGAIDILAVGSVPATGMPAGGPVSPGATPVAPPTPTPRL